MLASLTLGPLKGQRHQPLALNVRGTSESVQGEWGLADADPEERPGCGGAVILGAEGTGQQWGSGMGRSPQCCCG